MFDGLHFTGVINLGNLATAVINLIGVIALYIRVKAKIKEYSMRDKLTGGQRKDDPPLTDASPKELTGAKNGLEK